MDQPAVYLALPHRLPAAAIPLGALRTGDRANVKLRPASRSLLPHCFNVLWCGALNDRPLDYFAMLHDDVVPADGWLDVMLAELDRTGADVLSAVVPIKDERGLTSTALRDPASGWLRRLTVAETNELPETFSARDTDSPECELMVNTGLMVCRFDAAWVEDICFREQDGIRRDDQGVFHAVVLSEDWLFSMDAAALGLTVMATRKVPVRHVGAYGFPNAGAWGQWQTDQEPSAPFAGVVSE